MSCRDTGILHRRACGWQVHRLSVDPSPGLLGRGHWTAGGYLVVAAMTVEPTGISRVGIKNVECSGIGGTVPSNSVVLYPMSFSVVLQHAQVYKCTDIEG